MAAMKKKTIEMDGRATKTRCRTDDGNESLNLEDAIKSIKFNYGSKNANQGIYMIDKIPMAI